MFCLNKSSLFWLRWFLYEIPAFEKFGLTMKLLITVYGGKQLYYIKVIYDVTWLFTWRHFITCFNKIRQNILFCPLGYIAVVGIQVEKPRGNPYEKYRGVPKGGVIKGCDKGGVIKGVW